MNSAKMFYRIMFALFCFPFLGYSYDILQFRKLTVIQNPFLLKTHGTSMFHCAEHCYCLDACKSYNYDRKQKVCTIFNIVLTKDDLEDNDDFIYTEKDKIPSNLGRSCANCIKSSNVYTAITSQLKPLSDILILRKARERGQVLEAESFTTEPERIHNRIEASNGMVIRIESKSTLQFSLDVRRPVKFQMELRYLVPATEKDIFCKVFINSNFLWSDPLHRSNLLNTHDTYVVFKDPIFFGKGTFLIHLVLETEVVSFVEIDNLLIYCFDFNYLATTDVFDCGFNINAMNILFHNFTRKNLTKSTHLFQAEDFQIQIVKSISWRSNAAEYKAVHLISGGYIRQPVCVKGSITVSMNWILVSNDGCSDHIVIRLQSLDIAEIETEEKFGSGDLWNMIKNISLGIDMILDAGEFYLEILPTVTDIYGVEIDALSISVTTNDGGQFSFGSCS